MRQHIQTDMNNSQIPSKTRGEWAKMITGEITHQYRNFVLQMQISQARKDVQLGIISIDDAIEKIYSLCAKYKLAVRADLLTIFKTW